MRQNCKPVVHNPNQSCSSPKLLAASSLRPVPPPPPSIPGRLVRLLPTIFFACGGRRSSASGSSSSRLAADQALVFAEQGTRSWLGDVPHSTPFLHQVARVLAGRRSMGLAQAAALRPRSRLSSHHGQQQQSLPNGAGGWRRKVLGIGGEGTLLKPTPCLLVLSSPNLSTKEMGGPEGWRLELFDAAVFAEQSWWKLLDFEFLKRSSISFFDINKQETAVSKWSRARARAAKFRKGLSKDDKPRKLTLQH
ncbi:hypothetical protein QYE76_002163 [Lolium multiflorum]|uniref:Uncharacterized protein n=1 Tax=Lolium multiflorum TaxID=4521 RepID=A0AAD8RMN3_LOLMU|nr:hypothetical protein QYE76_002163 [Lolium multiflorum]